MSHAAKKGIWRVYRDCWDEHNNPWQFKNTPQPEWEGLEKTWYKQVQRYGKIGDLEKIDNKEGCVYLISYELGGPLYYKVGMSNNMEKRINSLRSSMPDGNNIKLLKYATMGMGYRRYNNASDCETKFLVAVRDYLITSEWFRLDIGEHKTYLKTIIAEYNK